MLNLPPGFDPSAFIGECLAYGGLIVPIAAAVIFGGIVQKIVKKAG